MNYSFDAPQTKLYVGNLSYETTEDDLRKLFTQVGTVIQVALIKDRSTGSSKEFAFITMNSQEEANQAIERFSRHSIGHREMKVSFARPREERAWSKYDVNRPGGYGALSPRPGSGRGY